MVAVGITSKGKRLKFVCSDDNLYCHNSDLVSLEVPEGVKRILCRNNKLSELKLPESVKEVSCYDNKLTELIIPESVELLICDKEVIGLEEFIGKIKIDLW